MQFKYFKANFATTIEEAKRQYRKLALRHHPDMGGSTEAMQQINAEWDYLRKHNYNIHEAQNGSVYTDWQQDRADDVTERFAEIIEKIIKMEGIEIEICGSFLWLGGDTYSHKAEIRSMGFKWAPRKKRWFMAPADWRKKCRREYSMDEIRSMHGSQIVSQGRMALSA